jgi:phage terminase large subunit
VDIVLQAKEEEENNIPQSKRQFYCIQYSSQDNPYYPKEEYNRMKDVLPPALFQMRYMGLFTKLSGLVYPDYDQVISNEDPQPIISTAIKHKWEFFGGLDFGFRDPFVALVAVEDPTTKILHLIYEHYLDRTTIPKHFQILEKANMANSVVYFGDPSGAQQIADLHSFGLQVIKANNDILAGIETTSARIMSKGLKIYRQACPNLCRELAIHRYASEEEDGMQVRARGEKPIDKDNHAADALRYLIRGVDGDTISTAYVQEETKEPKTPNIPLERYGDGPNISSKSKTNQEILEKRKTVLVEDTEFDPLDLNNEWCTPDNPAVWQIHGN